MENNKFDDVIKEIETAPLKFTDDFYKMGYEDAINDVLKLLKSKQEKVVVYRISGEDLAKVYQKEQERRDDK